jgi:tryptophan synthase alpha chain
MSRLAETFARLDGRPALIPFLMAGDPDLEGSGRLLRAVARVGDIVEVGVPFSDPIADGPTNQRAAQRALTRGTTLDDVLALVRALGGEVPVPVVLLTYANPVAQYGWERFCRDARAAGVDGVVVPDLPADEADPLIAPARALGLDTIFLVAPTTSRARLQLAAGRSTGFVYCVSLTGVTGVRRELPPEAVELLRRVKAATDLPACAGFGIATPEQAEAVGAVADGVIVGSALVDLVERHGPAAETPLVDLLGRIRQALATARAVRASEMPEAPGRAIAGGAP